MEVEPHDEEMEAIVLGSLLIEQSCFDNYFNRAQEGWFHVMNHRVIFNAMVKVEKNNQRVDIMTIILQLKNDNKLEGVGGASAITSLTNKIASTANIEVHIKILQQLNIRRMLMKFSRNLYSECTRVDNDPLDIQATFLNKISDLADFSFESNDLVHIKDIIASEKDEFEEKVTLAKKGIKNGIITRFERFDKKIGAFRKGNLITIAARPGVGKTSVLISFAKNISSCNHPVLIFSLEMTRQELLYRFDVNYSEGKINTESLQSGAISDEDILLKHDAEFNLSKLPITISDIPQTLSAITRKVKRWSLENKDGIVMIDYAQLIMPEYGSRKSPEQEVSEIARGLKNLAKECECPIIMLSQLSRAVESRTDKRPINSDLRQSGEIENASDMIVMLYRDEYYDIFENHEGESTIGVMEWIVRKNRHGGTGFVKVFYNNKISNFSDEKISSYEPMQNSLKPSGSFDSGAIDF